MEMRKTLIDTNIYSNAMRGDSDITGILKKMDEIGISVITVGELLSGFKGGTRESKKQGHLFLQMIYGLRRLLFSTVSHYSQRIPISLIYKG